MNEDVKKSSMHIHSRADELIACLEGEIAKRDETIARLEADNRSKNGSMKAFGEQIAGLQKAVRNRERLVGLRDARIMGLESQYQRDVWGLNNEGDPIGGEPAGGYANDNARLRAELAALKAQDTVGEVVGWYRLDRPYEMTPYPSVCATWHRLGAPVAPLYAAHAQQVSVPDGWRELAKRADDFLYSLPETDGVLRLRADLCSMLAAPVAPAADAGVVLEQAMYALISIGYHENSGLVHELRQSLAAHRSMGVV